MQSILFPSTKLSTSFSFVMSSFCAMLPSGITTSVKKYSCCEFSFANNCISLPSCPLHPVTKTLIFNYFIG